jgi:hypothetical protein
MRGENKGWENPIPHTRYLNYITMILINNSSARYIFLLNNILCKKYMKLSIILTGKEVIDVVIMLRMKIREYYKLHNIMRRKLIRMRRRIIQRR